MTANTQSYFDILECIWRKMENSNLTMTFGSSFSNCRKTSVNSKKNYFNINRRFLLLIFNIMYIKYWPDVSFNIHILYPVHPGKANSSPKISGSSDQEPTCNFSYQTYFFNLGFSRRL